MRPQLRGPVTASLRAPSCGPFSLLPSRSSNSSALLFTPLFSPFSALPLGIATSSRRHLRLDIGYGKGCLLAELDDLGYTNLIGVEKNPSLANKVMFQSGHKWKGQPRWITGNGLGSFVPGEVQQAVMAGFGENQIVRILQQDQKQALACHRLVFCPAISTGILRPYLYFTKNWRIVEEELVKEFDRFYSVLCVERGEEKNVKDDLDLFIGPFNMSRPHPLLAEYLEDCRERYFKDWEHMSQHKDLYCSFLRSIDRALKQKQHLLGTTQKRALADDAEPPQAHHHHHQEAGRPDVKTQGRPQPPQ